MTRPAFDVRAEAGVAILDADAAGDVLLLEGDAAAGRPRVVIRAGDARFEADQAFVRSRREADGPAGGTRRRLDVVFSGGVAWQASGASGEAEVLAVDVVSRGPVTLDALRRRPAAAADAPRLARAAATLEWAQLEGAAPVVLGLADPPQPPDDAGPDAPDVDAAIGPALPPTLPPLPVAALQAGSLRTVPDARGDLAVEATGGVFVLRQLDDGTLVELRADRAVVFTDVRRLDALADLTSGLPRAARGVYLEGDVRVNVTPPTPGDARVALSDQRLRARRAYVDLTTGRATLGEAVLHYSTSGVDVPLVVRAATVRRAADGSVEARDAQLSTSGFRTPLLSLNASRVFVREGNVRTARATDDAGGVVDGTGRGATFGADNVTPRVFGVPAFYLPVVRGSPGAGRLPLRSFGFGDDRNRGPYVATTWGLRETFGRDPRDELDATYEVAYFGDRGPFGAAGYTYGSDVLLPAGPGVTLFTGRGRLEVLGDSGRDNLPARRQNQDQDSVRVRLDLAHAQYFPGGAAWGGEDYNVFARYGYVRDPTYLEVWDRRRFYQGAPHDLRLAAARRGADTTAGIDLTISTSPFVTTAEALQENADVERLPELSAGTYARRVGPLSVSGEVRAGFLAFDTGGEDVNGDFGFRGGIDGFRGTPTYATTGRSERVVPRLDVRQEAAVAADVGPVRARPFVVGRATGWGRSPTGDSVARVLGGVGMGLTSAFARVDDGVFSRVLGIDRLRHVVEPYADAFAGLAAGADVADAYVYDEDVDVYGSIAAGRVGLRQRWQTYRGPPGGKRVVDLVTLDVSASVFDAGADVRDYNRSRFATSPFASEPFRGVYHPTRPEASVPADVAEAYGSLQVDDRTLVGGGVTYGLDTDDLELASARLDFNRGGRLNGGVGADYIGPVDATVIGGRLAYEISARYSVVASTSYDLDLSAFRNNTLSVTRRFERATFEFETFFDRVSDDRGVRFAFTPGDVPLLRIDSNTLTN